MNLRPATGLWELPVAGRRTNALRIGADFKYLAKMVALVAVLAGALHIVVTAAAATFSRFYYQERLFDLRAPGVPSAEIPRIIGGYIGSMVDERVVVTVGSSLTFGHPFTEKWTMAGNLNRMGIQTVNLGVTALGLQGISHWVLCEMQSRNIKARAVVLEIPLINEMSWLPHQATEAARTGPCPSKNTGGLFRVFVERLYGIDWVPILRDRYRNVNPPDYPNLERRVPDGYFATSDAFKKVIPVFRENIALMYAQAKSISDNVILFVSPVYLEGLAGRTDQEASVREQFAGVLKMCQEIAGSNCVDTTPLTAHELNFYNLSHINGNGAKALANLIAPKIAR